MAPPKNDLLLRAARREPTERTPVWLMRQAGRADPRYRALRQRVDLPLEALFRDPALAAEISLLPKRIGVDAVILFQDILTPLAPMGADFAFRPGPTLADPVRSVADVKKLRPFDPAEALGFVAETLRQLRDAVGDELPILGFAGAPLTLAMFLIEGGSPAGDWSNARCLMRDDPKTFHRLLERLADMTTEYLLFQMDAGADAVQLFDSFADLVSPEAYREFAHPYHQRILSKLAGRAPAILFCRECRDVALMVESGADVLSVGSCVDLADAKRRYGRRVAFQGNVDPKRLAAGAPHGIDEAVAQCVRAGGGHGHILNLSHGVLPDTPWENVERFVQAARACSRDATAAVTATEGR